ncbi:MAG TPA: hypothetical protein EYG68_00300 [Leucothrix mucor]|nr:hypothetical protein [Leucothrix mucor]
MQNNMIRYVRQLLLLSIVLLGVACNSNSSSEELEFSELMAPLRCTIPGVIQLDTETISALDKYKK